MFTGIVREVGTAASFDGSRLVVAGPETAAGVAVGDSVAIAGVCLTVVETGRGGSRSTSCLRRCRAPRSAGSSPATA